MSSSPAPDPSRDSSLPGDTNGVPDKRDELRALKFVVGALAAGPVMVGIVRVFVEPEVVSPSALAVIVAVVALLGAALAVRYIGYNLPALPGGLPVANAATTSVREFSSSTILRAAICEVPMIIAVLISFALPPRSWLPLLVALPGSLLLFWLHAWPSPRTVAASEEALERDGAKSYLGEAFGMPSGPMLRR